MVTPVCLPSNSPSVLNGDCSIWVLVITVITFPVLTCFCGKRFAVTTISSNPLEESDCPCKNCAAKSEHASAIVLVIVLFYYEPSDMNRNEKLYAQFKHLRLFSRKLVIKFASGRSSGFTSFLNLPV